MNFWRIFPIILFPGFLLGAIDWEKEQGEFGVTISLSKENISLDENLILAVKLRYPEAYTPDLDHLRMNILKYVGLSEPPFALAKEEIQELADGKTEVVFTLEPLLDGIHFLSFYDIDFLGKDPEKTEPQTIISDIFEVEVTLPPLKQNFIGTIYPLLSLTDKFPITITQANRIALIDNPKLLLEQEQRNVAIVEARTFPWPELLGALLFGVVILILRMQPPRKKDLSKLKKKLAITARKKAIFSLASLSEKQLLEKAAFEQYYNCLTDTVRKYIEEKYQIEATTKTTPEFLLAMSESPVFDDKAQTLLQEFLVSADRVKFTTYQPSSQECTQAHSMAKQFIEWEGH